MATFKYTKSAIVSWTINNITVYPSEHNRAALSVSNEQIERAARMADGTMRKNTVASKRTWSFSWDDLPSATAKTVDKRLGGQGISDYFYTNQGKVVKMVINSGVGAIETVYAYFADFSHDVKKRGPVTDLWSLSLTMEEV